MIIEDVGRFLNHEGTSDEDFASKELQKISLKDAPQGSLHAIKRDAGRIHSSSKKPPHQTIIEESSDTQPPPTPPTPHPHTYT